MEQNPNFTHNMDVLFSNLEDFAKKETILGKPVTYGDKTLVPVMSVTIGYGSGNTPGKNPQSGSNASQTAAASMGALGLGARISTDAVVVIDKDNVSMLPTSEKSNLSSMMDKIPQMISSMGMGSQQQNQPNPPQGQQGSQNGQ